jgi:hypothetical protein
VKSVQTTNNATINQLISACRDCAGLDSRDVLEAISSPEWQRANRTNDWRNYVPSLLADSWMTLSVEARLVAYLMSSLEACLE